MKWIAMEEQKPTPKIQFALFLVATDKGVGVAEYWPMEGFRNLRISGNTQYSSYDVTHWMPLLQPPAE